MKVVPNDVDVSRELMRTIHYKRFYWVQQEQILRRKIFLDHWLMSSVSHFLLHSTISWMHELFPPRRNISSKETQQKVSLGFLVYVMTIDYWLVFPHQKKIVMVCDTIVSHHILDLPWFVSELRRKERCFFMMNLCRIKLFQWGIRMKEKNNNNIEIRLTIPKCSITILMFDYSMRSQ